MTETSTNSESNTITIAAANVGKDNWQWKCLLSTFDKVGWKIRNRRLNLVVFGEEVGFDRNTALDVRFVGISSRKRTEQIISTAQITYCYQNFEPKFADHTRAHVPPELSLFLGSGRPLVFHAPVYAAPVEFLKTHKAAALCHHCEAVSVDLYNCFDRLIFDSQYYEDIASNGLRAAKHELITSITQDRMHHCIKVND